MEDGGFWKVSGQFLIAIAQDWSILSLMWQRYRQWKAMIAAPLGLGLWGWTHETEPGSMAHNTALVVAGLMGAAYLFEEMVWMFQGSVRPCLGCGKPIRPKSFRLQMGCSHCGMGV